MGPFAQTPRQPSAYPPDTAPASFRLLVIIALLAGCGEADVSAPTPTPDPKATPPDLNVQYISRHPRIEYSGGADHARAGWPSPGEEVTWRAHVRNWGDSALASVHYHWMLDGEVVNTGTVDLAAGADRSVELDWTWTFDRHFVEFALDPADEVDEEIEENNARRVPTDALALVYVIEEGLYDHIRRNRSRIESFHGVRYAGFEDWLKRQVDFLNDLFAQSRYESVPEGVLDRVRIDEIRIVPDGFISRQSTTILDLSPLTGDMFWHSPTRVLSHLGILHGGASFEHRMFDRAQVWMHEVMHSRYLLDMYAYDVHHGRNGSWVDIREEGELVAGSSLMPIDSNRERVYIEWTGGLMNDNTYALSEVSVLALNRIAGRRTPRDTSSANPYTTGSYQRELPDSNRLLLLDADTGEPIPGAQVAVFQDTSSRYYGEYYDSEPDLRLESDGTGVVELGPNPFGPPLLDPTYRNKSLTAIVRVRHAGRVGFGFLPAHWFNREAMRGNRERGEYSLRVDLKSP